MAVVDETVFVMLISGFWALAAYAAYLRLFVIRRLRRRIDQVVDTRLSAAPAVASAVNNESAIALTQVNRRLAVLERIVTDGGVETAAQIEALRDRAREPELTR
nr:hypothetical protein [uncultured Sphingomonas sp.]